MVPRTSASTSPVGSGSAGSSSGTQVAVPPAMPVEDDPAHSRPMLDETTIFTARGPRHYPVNDVCLNAARVKRAVAHWMEHR